MYVEYVFDLKTRVDAHFFVHTNFLAFVCWLYVVYVLTAAVALVFFGSLNVCRVLCMLGFADLLCMLCMFLKAVSAGSVCSFLGG